MVLMMTALGGRKGTSIREPIDDEGMGMLRSDRIHGPGPPEVISMSERGMIPRGSAATSVGAPGPNLEAAPCRTLLDRVAVLPVGFARQGGGEFWAAF